MVRRKILVEESTKAAGIGKTNQGGKECNFEEQGRR